MARKAGLIELFHGMSEEDPQTLHVLVHVHSKESMDKFMQEAGEDIAKSGHIESTEVTFLKTNMTLTVISKHSRTIQKLVKEQMK